MDSWCESFTVGILQQHHYIVIDYMTEVSVSNMAASRLDGGPAFGAGLIGPDL